MWAVGYPSQKVSALRRHGAITPERGESNMEIMCAVLFLVVATGYIIVVAQQAKK
jgi:hypothetical protein